MFLLHLSFNSPHIKWFSSLKFLSIRNFVFLLVQIYVDNNIFGATNKSICKDFSSIMKGVQNVINGGAYLILKIADKTNISWHVHKPNKVLLGTSKEI